MSTLVDCVIFSLTAEKLYIDTKLKPNAHMSQSIIYVKKRPFSLSYHDVNV